MKTKQQIEQRIAKKRDEVHRIIKNIKDLSDKDWQDVDEYAIGIEELEWVLEKR